MRDSIRQEVERRYQIMTGGPELTERWQYGVFIEVVEKDLCQFEMQFDESELPEIADVCKVLMEQLAASPLSPAEQWKIMKEFLTIMRRTSEYCIIDEIPVDAVLVVRRNALTDFISSVSGTPVSVEKPVGARERTSYLNIVGAMLAQLITSKVNDTTVITRAVTDFGGKPGISERKLQEVFAAAKRSLGAS